MKAFERLKARFVNWCIPRVKYWGVTFEKDLPPEFIITYHAEQRLAERFKCLPDKYKKVVVKAWNSKEEANFMQLKQKYKHSHQFRSFQGHLFVFDTKWIGTLNAKQKILITVYRPGEKY